jgi:uncharacterized SAM-binding protein YcdF (DUF218 family)
MMIGDPSILLQPYSLALLLSALGLAILWRRRRESRGRLMLVTASFAAIVAISEPISGYLALGSLEWSYPPPEPEPAGIQAVVVLAGNLSPPDGPRRRAELGHTTVYRCIHAAKLYRRLGPLPVLVCGGPAPGGSSCPPVAEVMREFLVEMGVVPTDLLVEADSRTTHENAVGARAVLDPLGYRRVFLVTEASHMPRAERCFRKEGFHVVPSACRYRATSFKPTAFGIVPTLSAAQACHDALHEWLGLAWYRLRGHI